MLCGWATLMFCLVVMREESYEFAMLERVRYSRMMLACRKASWTKAYVKSCVRGRAILNCIR